MKKIRLGFSFFAALAVLSPIVAHARDTIVADCGRESSRRVMVIRSGVNGQLYGTAAANGLSFKLNSCEQVSPVLKNPTDAYTVYRCGSAWKAGDRANVNVGYSKIGGKGHGASFVSLASGDYTEQNGNSRSLGAIQPCKFY